MGDTFLVRLRVLYFYGAFLTNFFMQESTYTVFRADPPAVGFAPVKHSGGIKPISTSVSSSVSSLPSSTTAPNAAFKISLVPFMALSAILVSVVTLVTSIWNCLLYKWIE